MRMCKYLTDKINILQDTLFYLLASIVPALLLVLVNPFLAKNLSPDDYAIIGYISSFASIVTPLVTFMLMRYYFVNYFKVDEDQRYRIKCSILQLLICFSLLMSILVIICILIYHYCFNSGSTLPVVPYLFLSVGAIWLGAIFTFQLSEYRIQRNSGKYLLFSISNGIIKIGLLLLLVVLCGLGALGYELATALTALFCFVFCFFRYRRCIFTKIDWGIISSALRFCWPIAFAGCLEFFSNGLGRVLIERLNDNVEYGYYSVGNQFATYLNLITAALFTTFNPDIYECASKRNISKLYKLFFILVSVEIFVVLLFVVFAPFIVDILTAGRYIMSVKYAQILAISQIFTIIFYYINDVTIAFGYPKVVLYTKMLVGIISIFLLNFLVSHFQYLGAAWGQSTIFILNSLVNISIILFMFIRKI